MIKKILFLTLLISLVVLAGCSKQADVKQGETTSDLTNGAIQEADSVADDIEDAVVEEELDDIESTLSDW